MRGKSWTVFQKYYSAGGDAHWGFWGPLKLSFILNSQIVPIHTKERTERFFSRYLNVLCFSAFMSNLINRGKGNQAFIIVEVCCAMLFGFVYLATVFVLRISLNINTSKRRRGTDIVSLRMQLPITTASGRAQHWKRHILSTLYTE